MLGCLMGTASTLAQAAESPAVASTRLDDATPRDYDIAQGPLGTALGVFASQSGLLLSYDPELTRGRAAPALKGRYTVQEGARRLLANSGLQLLPNARGAYILIPQAQASATATELTPTMVAASELVDPQRDTYRAPRSTVHLSREDLDRFSTVSVGDMLKGVAGVQVGDSRNGGALDVNIRGIQGQSRVAVRVDGSEQAVD
ncbi:MAG: TonB-dependent receptor plug domain-containing protein, partial [Pseudomonas sp.]|nr:TonB-dependent receptor plug domain-containing protein [Pseudomonas sp.]